MHNKEGVIQRLVCKDRDCLNELYDKYIHHIQRIISNSGLDPIDHEKIISRIFLAIWSSPEILNKEKHISVAITKLCLTLTKAELTSVS
ncbi:hypothetical protein [Pseudalkalibacillus hwajinpoensis]|uniref:RNA polymerase sigma-70 region 2 domain-containing protein n=1 Tax=Guptibacillus hwajinpoensis TaxID=208199 RepID=A0A4U1MM77_9BACL|nr:hypothetical protein [Pseudalkalibacillus hwajinpoensis]TKD72373.1 hypothetical protein FBF83_06225 [Pseudalkalibacillus hwajinpoensis]